MAKGECVCMFFVQYLCLSLSVCVISLKIFMHLFFVGETMMIQLNHILVSLLNVLPPTPPNHTKTICLEIISFDNSLLFTKKIRWYPIIKSKHSFTSWNEIESDCLLSHCFPYPLFRLYICNRWIYFLLLIYLYLFFLIFVPIDDSPFSIHKIS